MVAGQCQKAPVLPSLGQCKFHKANCGMSLFLQVHDVNGQLQCTLEVLQQQAGFKSVVQVQVPELRQSTLYNVYAVGKQPQEEQQPAGSNGR